MCSIHPSSFILHPLAMIHSMTGFGRAAGALSSRYFVAVTAKSVNHRFLETSVRLPEYMWEGETLHADITARLAQIRELQRRLAEHREEIRAELLGSYRQRVQEIASAAGVDVDQDRIAQEVVLMVEKGDIAEELTRLAHHVDQIEIGRASCRERV